MSAVRLLNTNPAHPRPTISKSTTQQSTSTSNPETNRRHGPSKTETTRHPNPSRAAASHQPRQEHRCPYCQLRGEGGTRAKTTTTWSGFMTPVRRARDDDSGRQTNKVTHHTSTTCHFHQPDSAPTLDTNDALHHRDHASSHRIDTATLHHRAEPTATRELRLRAHTQHSHSHKRQDRTETDPTPSAWQKGSSHTAQSQTARRNDKVIQVLEFAFATSEQQSKIEKKKEAMDTNSKTAGTRQKTPRQESVNNRKLY